MSRCLLPASFFFRPIRGTEEAISTPSLFSLENMGEFGNAKRRFFSGPGINNWDMALAKDIQLTEATSLELRAEFFNIFNHAQFVTPSGLINSGSFGVVTNANDPRIGQVAAKFKF